MSELRCHRCSHWIGESSRAVELTGLFKSSRDVAKYLPDPRDTWVCKSCGWANVFRTSDTATWRTVELKGLPKAG